MDEMCHGSGERESSLVHGHQSLLASIDDSHLAGLILLLGLMIVSKAFVTLLFVLSEKEWGREERERERKLDRERKKGKIEAKKKMKDYLLMEKHLPVVV